MGRAKSFEERRIESLNIIRNLQTNGYTSKQDGIREFIEEVTDFMRHGIQKDLHIPIGNGKFIVGTLETHRPHESKIRITENP